MRTGIQIAAAGALLAALYAVPALAKCAVSAEEGVSRSGLVKVVPTLAGEFTLLTRVKPGEPFVQQKQCKLTLFGHHIKTLVPDSGQHFILFDAYAGVEIHRADGTLVRRFEPKDLMNAKELAERPGTFACHKEGRWTESDAAFSPGERSVRLKLYTGKVVEIALDGTLLTTPQARR